MSAQVAYSAELDDSILTRGLPIFVIAPLVFTTFMLGMAAVSYTHLTLPTILLV